jgi:hypothetical protein
MTVENAEEGELGRVNLRVEIGASGEIKHGGVRILHADTPALHGGDTVDESVILALVGSL